MRELTRERIAEVERVFVETHGNIRPSEVAALCAMARAMLDERERADSNFGSFERARDALSETASDLAAARRELGEAMLEQARLRGDVERLQAEHDHDHEAVGMANAEAVRLRAESEHYRVALKAIRLNNVTDPAAFACEVLNSEPNPLGVALLASIDATKGAER